MGGIPDRRWDDIQRGRDPDSLYWERAREEAFERTQREARHEMDQWELDIRRNQSIQDGASPVSASPRDDILQCRKDILDRLRFSVWLDAHLKEDWISRLANLTEAGWDKELTELRRDVANESEGWRRANANNPWRREQYGAFLRDLGNSLELLKLRCRNLSDGRQKA